jgi:hypothetical protein
VKIAFGIGLGNLLRATGDFHYVAQQLAHSSVKVTEDCYLHLTHSDQRVVVEVLPSRCARSRTTTGT